MGTVLVTLFLAFFALLALGALGIQVWGLLGRVKRLRLPGRSSAATGSTSRDRSRS